MSRPAPRPFSMAIGELTATLAPGGTLAAVQELWPEVVGATIAAAARPVAARDGVLSVTCEASVWAQELDLMAGEIIARLNERLAAEAIVELRCRTG